MIEWWAVIYQQSAQSRIHHSADLKKVQKTLLLLPGRKVVKDEGARRIGEDKKGDYNYSMPFFQLGSRTMS
jgi:hypothetical protein